jgi:hypothetical protein
MYFKSHYGQFKYIMMPFDLTNALVVFQHLMNDIFCEYLDDFMVCYINEILIFSKNVEDHKQHVRLILDKFKEVELYAKLEKCEFFQIKVDFLGYIISKMAFTCIPIRFKPLCIGLPQFLFMMFKIFLGQHLCNLIELLR